MLSREIEYEKSFNWEVIRGAPLSLLEALLSLLASCILFGFRLSQNQRKRETCWKQVVKFTHREWPRQSRGALGVAIGWPLNFALRKASLELAAPSCECWVKKKCFFLPATTPSEQASQFKSKRDVRHTCRAARQEQRQNKDSSRIKMLLEAELAHTLPLYSVSLFFLCFLRFAWEPSKSDKWNYLRSRVLFECRPDARLLSTGGWLAHFVSLAQAWTETRTKTEAATRPATTRHLNCLIALK